MAPKNNCNSHLNGRVRREISRRIILEQDRKDNEEWFHHHRAWNSDLNRRVRRDVEFRRNLEAEENIDENAEELNRRGRNLEAEEKIARDENAEDPNVEQNVRDEDERQNGNHVHVISDISDEEDQAHFSRKSKRQIAVDEKNLRKMKRKIQLRMGSNNKEAFFLDMTKITRNLALDLENEIN